MELDKYIESAIKSVLKNPIAEVLKEIRIAKILKQSNFVNGINIVSLNYADSYSTFQLDFAICMNKKRRKEIVDFTASVHHRSNAYRRRNEGLEGKNRLAMKMVERALNEGIRADYLLVDSWYAKPNFLSLVNELGLPIIARTANNERIWHFMLHR